MLNLRPRALVLQIGSNAALRGEDPKSLSAPLQTALAGGEARYVPVLALGPQHAPANLPERHMAVKRVLEAGARRHRARWLARHPGLSVGPDGLHHDDAGHDDLARLVADARLLMLLEKPA
jgi:hypothetical protein